MFANSNTINLLHLTDTHLFAEAGKRLVGLDTDLSLQAVLAHVAAGDQKPDAILVSGDLAQDAQALSYARLLKMLAPFGVPVHVLPGNHDLPGTMHEVCGAAATPVVDLGAHWRLVMLDTSIRDSAAGALAPDQLELLAHAVAGSGARSVLLAMHHNPVPMGSTWLDTMQISNSADLFAMLAQMPQIKAVLWGHVHQEYDAWHEFSAPSEARRLRLLATPSTCFQFAAHSQNFGLDDLMPGYRWLGLHPAGELTTELLRVPALPSAAGRASFDSAGY